MEQNCLFVTIQKRIQETECFFTWDCVMKDLDDCIMFTFFPVNYFFLETSYVKLRRLLGIDPNISGFFVVDDYKDRPNIGIRFFASKDAFLPNQLY